MIKVGVPSKINAQVCTIDLPILQHEFDGGCVRNSRNASAKMHDGRQPCMHYIRCTEGMYSRDLRNPLVVFR